jgi:hypothetical protein
LGASKSTLRRNDIAKTLLLAVMADALEASASQLSSLNVSVLPVIRESGKADNATLAASSLHFKYIFEVDSTLIGTLHGLQVYCSSALSGSSRLSLMTGNGCEAGLAGPDDELVFLALATHQRLTGLFEILLSNRRAVLR